MFTPASASPAPLRVFRSTRALYAWARFIRPFDVEHDRIQESSNTSGTSDWR